MNLFLNRSRGKKIFSLLNRKESVAKEKTDHTKTNEMETGRKLLIDDRCFHISQQIFTDRFLQQELQG